FTWNALRREKRVDLHTRTIVRRLDVDDRGRIVRAVAVRRGAPNVEVEYRAKVFVVAGGYVWSSHLLLASRSVSLPNGVANSSGLVGKYLCGHRNVQAFVRLPLKLYPGRSGQHALVRMKFKCVDTRVDGPHVGDDLSGGAAS